MTDIRVTGPTLAPPLPPTNSDETKTSSNVNNKHNIAREAEKSNSKFLSALATDCMALENIAQEFESRDEQATNNLLLTDLEYRNNQNDGIETVLNILDKNIVSASTQNNGRLTTKRHKQKDTNALALPAWTLGSAVDEFLRVHNCEPLLESDEESDNESCYSQASCRSRNVTKDDRSSADNTDEKKQEENSQEMRIKSLEAELNVSREAISALESQLCSHTVPSPMQITQLVEQKREVEELATQKRTLEAQLASIHQQLAETKEDAMNSSNEKERLQEANDQLKDALSNMMLQNKDTFEFGSSDLNDPPPMQCGVDSDMDNATIRKLRFDLAEAHNIIKELEKHSTRERKHHHRLMEGATNNKSDIDTRLKIEIDNNLELRRKCYVLEQKLNGKKKIIIDFEYDLNRVVDELDAKNRQNESLIHQVDHLSKLVGDDNRQHIEMDCLQDINESLNEELAATLEENKRLKEQLRRIKTVSSHKTCQLKKTGATSAHVDKQNIFTNTNKGDVATKDIYAQALEYLNEVEGEGNISKSKYQIKHTGDDQELKGRENQINRLMAHTHSLSSNDKQVFLQESRKRFESLHAEYGK